MYFLFIAFASTLTGQTYTKCLRLARALHVESASYLNFASEYKNSGILGGQQLIKSFFLFALLYGKDMRPCIHIQDVLQKKYADIA